MVNRLGRTVRARGGEALGANTDLDARVIAGSMAIASDICIYTNHQLTIEEL